MVLSDERCIPSCGNLPRAYDVYAMTFIQQKETELWEMKGPAPAGLTHQSGGFQSLSF